MKVCLSGTTGHQEIEWKNPASSLQRQSLPTYEVILTPIHSNHSSRYYLYGDMVCIRARVLRFSPLLNGLGVQNICLVDSLSSDYFAVEKKNTFPIQSMSTLGNNVSLLQKLVWNLWEKVFFTKLSLPFIKSACMEAVYFPLVDKKGDPFQGSFFVTIHAGGLSSLQEKK